MKLSKSIIGFLSCIVAAFVFFVLHTNNVSLFMLSENYSIIYFGFIAAICIAAYFGMIIISKLRVQSRQGSDGEVKMLSSLYKVICFFALLMGIMIVFGKMESFGAFFSMFGGMLLGWSLQAVLLHG